MKKIGIVAVALLATVPFFFSQIASAYTSPGKPTGFVNDFAHILSPQEKIDLETTLSNYQKQSGNEISIVTTPSLGDETVETYAVALFKEWAIGQKGKDNGLLILQAPNERKIRIEVGYGLEPYITDAKATAIYRNILAPEFKAGRYAEGYTQAVSAIIATLNGQVDAVPTSSAVVSDYPNIIFWIVVVFIWLTSIFARSKSWWLGGVVGGVMGAILGIASSSFSIGGISAIILVILGLAFDYLVSKSYASRISRGLPSPWWIGSGRGGGLGGGGGFGGFGGGGSGGGGGGGGY